nr:nephrin-like isoform X2 [Cherax quadricarinatus]
MCTFSQWTTQTSVMVSRSDKTSLRLTSTSAGSATHRAKGIHLASLLLLCCATHAGGAGVLQRFVETPRSVQVREGVDVALRCRVAHQQGQAQWTKDGFALGFEREVPGYPRFTYLGDPKAGEHHLLITSVTSRDEGEYQCQVGPTATNPPIWAAANLTVLLPPVSIMMEGESDGSVLEVTEGENITLHCVVTGATPPPTVHWYLGPRLVDSAQVESQVVESSVPHRWSMRSQLVLTAEAEDDGQRVTCRGEHPAMVAPAVLSASRTLAVLHAPSTPVISGYLPGEVLVSGEHRTLTCRVSGGNPRPSLLWYRSGRLLDDTFSSDAGGSVNTYNLLVTSTEDNAQYECRAMNQLMEQPLMANITLTVHYPPLEVSVLGPSRVEAGTSVSLTCVTSEANPPASLTWLIQGEAVSSPAAVVSQVRSGGWVSRSRLVQKVQESHLREDTHQLQVVCKAQHPVLARPMYKTFLLSVTEPAGPPVLEGDLTQEVTQGTWLNLTCSAAGGHPQPTLRMYKDGVLIPTKVVQEGAVTRVRGQVKVTPADNGSEVKCEVTSAASGSPKVTSRTLTVKFAPLEVSVRAVPSTSQVGQVVRLTCLASSSHPPATITWTSGDVTLQGDVTYSTPAAFGGTSSRSELQVNTTAEDNGRVLVCQAHNGVGTPVSKHVTLNVLHPPVWREKPVSHLDVLEGTRVVLTAFATANPGPVRYWWSRGNERLSSSGGELSLGMVTRHMTANYTVTAYTSSGEINTSFYINVQYGPENISAPERVIVGEGENVNVQCSASGNPVPYLTWSTRNVTVSRGTGVALLTLRSVGSDSSAVYECQASSILASPQSLTTKLIVRQAVSLAGGTATRGSWVDLGRRARLVCHVRAAPPPTFTWTKDDETRVIQNNEKYSIYKPELVDGLVLWVSALEILQVTAEDYGTYHCWASNGLGSASIGLTLNPPTRPHPPTNLTIVNVSNVSVVLGWSPSFDGGKPEAFTVRYSTDTTLSYQYEDIEGSATGATVGGLTPGTQYTFSIQARNDRGYSDYTTPPIPVTTLGATSEAENSGNRSITSLLLLVIVVAALALLVLNVALIVCFLQLHKRRRNSCRSSSSMKMTSPVSPASTMTCSPDHHHLHHHHIHMSHITHAQKTARDSQADLQNKVSEGINSACPPPPSCQTASQIPSATKCTISGIKWNRTLKCNGKIPHNGKIYTRKKFTQNDSVFLRNQPRGKGREGSKSGSPETCSLIPKPKESSYRDKDQMSESSHDGSDAAIFSDDNVISSSLSGKQQRHCLDPDDHNVLSYVHQIRDELQHQRHDESQQQTQQDRLSRTLTDTATQIRFTQSTQPNSPHYQHQYKNHQDSCNSKESDPISSSNSKEPYEPEHLVNRQQQDIPLHNKTLTTTTNVSLRHQRVNSLTSAELQHLQPARPIKTDPQNLCFLSPTRAQKCKSQSVSQTRGQYRVLPALPTQAQKHQASHNMSTRGQRRKAPSSPRGAQRSQPSTSSSRAQFRKLLFSSSISEQRHNLPPDSPRNTQHWQHKPDVPITPRGHLPKRFQDHLPTRPQDHIQTKSQGHLLSKPQDHLPPSPQRSQRHTIPAHSPSTTQTHPLPPNSATSTQRFPPPSSPNPSQYNSPVDSLLRIQHRPPPVPKSQHRSPPTPPRRHHRPPLPSPKFSQHQSPSIKSKPALSSNTGKHSPALTSPSSGSQFPSPSQEILQYNVSESKDSAIKDVDGLSVFSNLSHSESGQKDQRFNSDRHACQHKLMSQHQMHADTDRRDPISRGSPIIHADRDHQDPIPSCSPIIHADRDHQDPIPSGSPIIHADRDHQDPIPSGSPIIHADRDHQDLIPSGSPIIHADRDHQDLIPSGSPIIHADRDPQAPAATSSPITHARRSKFPDDFLWHRSHEKL